MYEKADFAPGAPSMRLCLDFINTEGVVRNSPPDGLDSFELFAQWAARRGLGEVRDPGGRRTAAFLVRARELRETLYRIFTAVTQDAEPDAHDLELLNETLGAAASRLRLGPGDDGLEWGLEHDPERPEEALDRVALSAARLLTSDRLGRVKQCASETCGWMFIDESRNRSRRWCDMSNCGNRAKARRFYHRHADEDG